jgi:uncharacterized GH25 family protein
MRPLTLAVSALLCALLGAGEAAAHEFWLAPTSYAPKPRQAVEVGAVAGTGFRGPAMPFSSLRCVRLIARTDRTLDLGRYARNGELIWASFAPADGAGALLAFESTYTPIELPAREFDAYLRLEGLDAPLAARAKTPGAPGRERYRRCAKAWLAGTDVTRATKPIGLPLEVVPATAPGADPVLRVRVALDGKPLAGALVKAWRTAVDSTGAPFDPEARDSAVVAWQGRTNAKGETIVPVPEEGEWLVSAVHMVPCRDTSVADWESTWASLTFVRRKSR